MSALPPKADIVQHGGNVRLVPKADIHASFDLGGRKQRLRNSKAELLCPLQINRSDFGADPPASYT